MKEIKGEIPLILRERRVTCPCCKRIVYRVFLDGLWLPLVCPKCGEAFDKKQHSKDER